MSTLAVILIVVIVLLLLALLVVGGRKVARVRARRNLPPVDDDGSPYRSHAEESRRTSERP